MSEVETVMAFDTVAGTGTFSGLVAGVLTPLYTVTDSTSTVSVVAQSDDTTLDINTWSESLEDVRLFRDTVVRRLSLPLLASGPHTQTIKKTATEIELDFKIGSDKITNATWTAATNTIVFKKQAAFSCSWSDFINWWRYLDRARAEIRSFSVP